MKLVKLYEEIIRENEAQACVAKFGKELFDPQLQIGGEPSTIEPNTDVENNYLELIGNFTNIDYGVRINPNFVKAMDNLKSCMSSYPEVLQPEGMAYRGSRLTLRQLLTQYEDIADDLETGGEFDITYAPKSPIQSWTSEKDTAEGFASPSPLLMKFVKQYRQVKDNPEQLAALVEEIYPQMDDAKCPITISLMTSKDDFLFKAKYFTFLSQFEGEDELLRVNNKPTRVTAEIIEPLLDAVYGILTSIKRYEQLKNR